jgi:hypothetical protein
VIVKKGLKRKYLRSTSLVGHHVATAANLAWPFQSSWSGQPVVNTKAESRPVLTQRPGPRAYCYDRRGFLPGGSNRRPCSSFRRRNDAFSASRSLDQASRSSMAARRLRIALALYRASLEKRWLSRRPAYLLVPRSMREARDCARLPRAIPKANAVPAPSCHSAPLTGLALEAPPRSSSRGTPTWSLVASGGSGVSSVKNCRSVGRSHLSHACASGTGAHYS